MDQIVIANVRGKPLAERPGNSIKADLAAEVPIGDAVFNDWLRKRNGKLLAPIVVRCGDVHGQPTIHQPLRYRPGNSARPASKRTDRGNNMQYLQAPTPFSQ